MVDEAVLEQVYKERLEERLIAFLSEKYKIDYLEAMDMYYNSEMAERIHLGQNGIQYLDYKVLAEMMAETELNQRIS